MFVAACAICGQCMQNDLNIGDHHVDYSYAVLVGAILMKLHQLRAVKLGVVGKATAFGTSGFF